MIRESTRRNFNELLPWRSQVFYSAYQVWVQDPNKVQVVWLLIFLIPLPTVNERISTEKFQCSDIRLVIQE